MAYGDNQQQQDDDQPRGMMVGSVFPSQPEHQTETEAPYQDVQRRVGGGETISPGPQLSQALTNIDATTGKRVEAENTLTDVKTQMAGIEAAGAKATAGVYDQSALLQQSEHDQLAPEIARRMAQSKKDVEEFRAMPAPALFADRSTAGNIALAIGLAAATFSDAMAARAAALLGQAKGPSTVTAIINMDLDRQREKLKRASDKMAQSGKNVDEIRAYEDRLDKRIDAKRVIALERAQATLLMTLKGKGMDLAQAQGTKDALELQAAIDNAKANLVQGLVKKTNADEIVTTDKGAQVKTINRSPTQKPETGMASLRRDRIAANIHEYQKAAEDLPPGVITPEVLDIVQRNEAALHASNEAKGATGAVGVIAGRELGVIPKSRYDGLTPEQVRAVQDMDTMLQHGSEMQPSTGVEVSAAWKGVNIPKAGTTQADIDSRIEHLKAAGKDYKAIIDPNNIGDRANAPAPAAAPAHRAPAKAAPPPAVASPYSAADVAEAEAVLHNPKSDKEDRDQAIRVIKGKR